MLALALVVSMLAGSGPLLAQEAESNASPVRANSTWGQGLIAEGCRTSPSFLHLVEALRKTMLIVYVEPVHDLPGLVRAATTFLGRSGPYRYLRVSIGTAVTRKRQIALVAHELQHATEIAQAPEVVDAPSLASLYDRIGDRNRDGYDSGAARDMGDRVWLELWGPQSPTPPRGCR